MNNVRPRSWIRARVRIAVVAIAIALLCLLALQKPLRIAWHEHMTRRAYGMWISNTPPDTATIVLMRLQGVRGSDPWDLYVVHRDRLIKLRRLTRGSFRSEHAHKSGNLRALQTLAEREFPEAFEVGFYTFSRNRPPVFEFVDRPERMGKWKRFLTEHDVPDLAERLVQDEYVTAAAKER